MQVLVIQNCETEGIGLYEQYMIDKQIPFETIHPYKSLYFPSVDRYTSYIVGGTPIPANDFRKYTFLLKEWEFLRQVIEKELPYLGICFGGQVLSMLLGGEVSRNRIMEIGGYEVELTSVGGKDLIFKGFPKTFPVFQWHADSFDPPKGAKLLVEGVDCKNQAFRYKNFIALLFHLEIDSQQAKLWSDEYTAEIPQVKKTKEQIVEECRIRESEMKNLCYKLMENFFQLCDSVKHGNRFI